MKQSIILTKVFNPLNKSLKTLVVGASSNPSRYSNKAVHLLREYGHEVIAVGIKETMIADVSIQIGKPEIKDIHTITIYLNPVRQKPLESYLLSLKPKRIIFNPGAENINLFQAAKSLNIEVLNACTLVMLRTQQYA